MIRYPYHEGCGGPLLTLDQVGPSIVSKPVVEEARVWAEVFGVHQLLCGNCRGIVRVSEAEANHAERAAKVERGERVGKTSARITARRIAA